MADILQAPILISDSLFIALLFGTIVAAVAAAAGFLWFYFKNKMGKVDSKVGKLESRIDDIEGPWPEGDEIKERMLHVEGYLHHFSSGVEKELTQLQSHVLAENQTGLKNLRKDMLSKLTDGLTRNEMKISRIGASLSELKKEVEAQAGQSKKSSKNVNKQFKEMMRLYLFMMLEQMRDVKEESSAEIGLRNIRTFRTFAKKQKWWDKKMQESVLDFMREMERNSAGLSPLYSMFIDEIRKN
jgi:hypothetical protein